MAFLRISVNMKRINPQTNKPFKYGDIREDGCVFVQYFPSKPVLKNGFFAEYWLKPEKFKSRVEYSSKRKNNWVIKNKAHVLNYGKNHRKNNPIQYRAHKAKRRAFKLLRTPNWLTKDQIKEIEDYYTIASMFKMYTGEMYHVDHIVPLQGKKVSGLHVPWNLQVLPAKENIKKQNKHE